LWHAWQVPCGFIEHHALQLLTIGLPLSDLSLSSKIAYIKIRISLKKPISFAVTGL
jgi:hypothetical protein